MRTIEERIREFASFTAGVGRTELAEQLRLPAPTVVSAVRRMLATGELEEVAQRRPRAGAGRPAGLVRTAGRATIVGLITWQGDRLRVACLDVDGTVLVEAHLDAPAPHSGAEGLQPAVERAIVLARRQRGYCLRAVVISVPAPFLSGHGAPPGGVSSDALPAPFAVTATGDLESVLSRRFSLPIVIENDANLAAIGELYAGAARGAQNAVCLTVTGSGVGGAVIVNAALVRGAHGFAGELAHLQVDSDGPLCACGGRGCLLYRVRESVVASAQSAYDEPITFADLPRLAAVGDQGAARMMRDVGRLLGGSLAHLCTFLDPELLVIGGTLGPAAEHVVAGIRDVLAVQAPPAVSDSLVLATSELGAGAVLHGAVEINRLAARTR